MRALVLLAALLVGACATPMPAAVANGDLDNAPDGTRVTVRRGGEVAVKLDANIFTGFQWQLANTPGLLLSPIGQRIYVSKAADPHAVGSGGVNVFRFRAEKPGRLTLRFDYLRASEAGVAPAKTVRYDVAIE